MRPPTCFLIVSTLPLLTHGFGFGSTKRVPTSPAQRNAQMAGAVQSAMSSPKVPSCRLLECEFPAIKALNKLGDGSLQSAQAVDEANLVACTKLANAIAFPPVLSPRVCVVTSQTATKRFVERAKSKWPDVHALQQGSPRAKARDVFIFVSPASSSDYQEAKRLAYNGNTVIILNGFAKDTKSVPEEATMAYYLKPLTYNSQIAGFLTRVFPNPWTVSSSDGTCLGTFKDKDILVSGTNTPDLRQSVRLVQKASDERAIQSRALRQ